MSQSKIKKKPNPEFIIYSLQNQLAEAHMMIAERDAVITEYFHEIERLKKENGKLIEERTNELDKQAEEAD